MITWLKALFHIHEWETFDQREIQSTETKSRLGYIFFLRCKKCGNIKKVIATL